MIVAPPELGAFLRHIAGIEAMQTWARKFIARNRPPEVQIEYGVDTARQAESPSGAVDKVASEEETLMRPHWDVKAQHGTLQPSPAHRLLDGLKESFAKKEFNAAVCFVDMVGFSDQARGKSAAEVATFVAPFLRAIIKAATKNKCFVDKTFGDEVMVVMPVFPNVHEPIDDIAWFLADAIRFIETDIQGQAFRAGSALGTVFLDNIEAGSYTEWSVFGNCVNGAKRLQTLPSSSENLSRYRLVLGAVESEQPDFNKRVTRWLHNYPHIVPSPDLELRGPRIDFGDLKGVGRMCFVETYVSLKKQPQ